MPVQKIKDILSRVADIMSNLFKKNEEIREQAKELVEKTIKEQDQKKIDDIKNKISSI
jgi:hypothetical protein